MKGLQGHLARMKRGNFDKARQLMDECFQSLSTNKEFDIGARMWELSNGLFGTLPGAAPAAVPAVSLDVAAPSTPTGAAPALAAAAVVAQPPLMPTGLVDEEIVIRCKNNCHHHSEGKALDASRRWRGHIVHAHRGDAGDAGEL